MLPEVLCGVLTAAPTIAATGTVAVSLPELIDRARAVHPRARAAVEQAREARFRADSAGYWPDPSLTVAANNVPLESAVDGSPMTGLQFRLQQTVPWPGKLGRRSAFGDAVADVAGIEPQSVRLDLEREVALTYFQIHLLDITAEVYRANERILSTLIEVADAKYRSGRGQQQDVLRARLSRDQLRQRLIGVQRQRGARSATLTQLVGQPSSWMVPSLVDVPMAALRPTLTEQAILDLAETHSPELEAARRRRAKRVAAAALAEVEARPDLQLGVAYTVRGDAQGRDPARGSDFVSVTLGVRLPVQAYRRLPAIRSAEQAGQSRAQHGEATVRLRIRETVTTVMRQLPQLRRQARRLRDEIIPATRQTLAVERAAYQVDRDEMRNLLQTELQLIGRLIEFHTLHVEQEVLLVELTRAVGCPRSELIEATPDPSHHGEHP